MPTDSEATLDLETGLELPPDEINGDDDALPPEEDSAEVASTVDAKSAKRVADAQAALTRANQEKADMARELAELRGRVDQISIDRQPKQTQEAQKDIFDRPEFSEDEILNDPKNVRNALMEMRSQIVSLIDLRDRAYDERIARNDPAVIQQREAIAELRKDPDFSGFNDAALAVIAKKMPAKARADGFSGGFGGGRRASVPASETSQELERLTNSYMKRMRLD